MREGKRRGREDGENCAWRAGALVQESGCVCGSVGGVFAHLESRAAVALQREKYRHLALVSAPTRRTVSDSLSSLAHRFLTAGTSVAACGSKTTGVGAGGQQLVLGPFLR